MRRLRGRVGLRFFALQIAALLGGCATAPPVAPEAVYTRAAVATDHPVASEAGASMLRQGGNAVDAAVAASFCLSVVRPESCGIGGGGFMVIAAPPEAGGALVALNYRETTPAAVGPTYYEQLDDPRASVDGVRAAGVPGSVAGLLRALETWGTLDRPTVLAPAIHAAEAGYVVDAHFVQAVENVRERRDRNPAIRAQSEYVWRQLCHEGRARVGDRVTNPEQAAALRLIARDGAAAFYRGPIAGAMVTFMRTYGGAIDHADLDGYAPAVGAPLIARVAGAEIVTMPPPSSGGIVVAQVLGMLEARDALDDAPATAAELHLLTEAMKHAFADRARWLADPAFVDVPADRLLSPAYIAARASEIDDAGPHPTESYGTTPAMAIDGGTSHISVIDDSGMAVSCTETVNLHFGSMASVPGYGIVLNNEMDDFTTIRGQANAFGLFQSERNLPEPGKRPLSSMSPTIVLRDGRPWIVAGASGGPRIITGTLQALINAWFGGMPPEEAVVAPRVHHQWRPDVLRVEAAWTDDAVLDELRAKGHVVEIWDTDVGHVQLIRVDDDGVRAASDPRKGGRPAGM